MRNFILIVAAWLAGVVVAVAGAVFVFQPRLAQSAANVRALERTLAETRTELKALQNVSEAARERAAALEEALANCRRDMAEAEAPPVERTAPRREHDNALDLGELLPRDLFAPEETTGEPEEDGEEDSERRREWDARRRQFASQMRTRMLDYLNSRYEMSDDPAEQERLAALSQYVDYFSDMRTRRRQAETDEEREALRGELFENIEQMHTLIDEQRRHILSDAFEAQGIGSERRQQALAEAVLESMQDPFFRFGGPGGGGGPRGWGGRRGGGGERPR